MARAVGPASAVTVGCAFISSVTSRASTPSRFSVRCVIATPQCVQRAYMHSAHIEGDAQAVFNAAPLCSEGGFKHLPSLGQSRPHGVLAFVALVFRHMGHRR